MELIQFEPGDPFNGKEGTVVTADFLNSLVGELTNVIKAAGLEPSVQLQLLTALNTRFATLASPKLTGSPTTPTPAPGDNSKRLANTEFVQALFATLDQQITDATTALQSSIASKPSRLYTHYLANT